VGTKVTEHWSREGPEVVLAAGRRKWCPLP